MKPNLSSLWQGVRHVVFDHGEGGGRPLVGGGGEQRRLGLGDAQAVAEMLQRGDQVTETDQTNKTNSLSTFNAFCLTFP